MGYCIIVLLPWPSTLSQVLSSQGLWNALQRVNSRLLLRWEQSICFVEELVWGPNCCQTTTVSLVFTATLALQCVMVSVSGALNFLWDKSAVVNWWSMKSERLVTAGINHIGSNLLHCPVTAVQLPKSYPFCLFLLFFVDLWWLFLLKFFLVLCDHRVGEKLEEYSVLLF